MKIKNKTSSSKELTDILTGKRILVKPDEIIDLNRASYNKNVFEVVKDKTETKEKKITEKEVI